MSKKIDKGMGIMKILLTAFDPFANHQINPASEAIKGVANRIDGVEIIKLEIPTVFNKSALILAEAIKKEEPDYVLSIGQAGGRFEMTPERLAMNLDDARIPDNEGNQPIDQRIIEDGPTAYFSQLPIKAMVDYMKKEKIPASISNSAGTFVCNHLMYQSLYMTNTNYPDIKAGFMHIPFLPEQVINHSNTPSMSLHDIIHGLTVSIKAIIDFDGEEDLKITAGKTH